MPTDYERFNEMLFESYCKTSIDNAISKERKKKYERAKWERPLSALTDTELYQLTGEGREFDTVEDFMTVYTHEDVFRVRDLQIGRALSCLLSRDREIVLLYYFAEMNDTEIAARLRIPRATVQRRRTRAKEKLRDLIEGEV